MSMITFLTPTEMFEDLDEIIFWICMEKQKLTKS
jgi:hypothetical protein